MLCKVFKELYIYIYIYIYIEREREIRLTKMIDIQLINYIILNVYYFTNCYFIN